MPVRRARIVQHINGGPDGLSPRHGRNPDSPRPRANLIFNVGDQNYVSTDLSAGDSAQGECWLEIAQGDGWVEGFRFVNQDGYITLAEARIRPGNPTGDVDDPGRLDQWDGLFTTIPKKGLTARRFKNITPGNAERIFGDIIRDRHDGGSDVEGSTTLDFYGFTADVRRRPRQGRSPGTQHDDLFFAKIANRYVNICDRPKVDRGSVEVLAEDLHYSINHMRYLLKQARDRGMLTKNPPGRAGGDLTPKANRLLATHEREDA